MDNFKNIIVKTKNLPFNMDKSLSDLLMLLGFTANAKRDDIVGELYLTAELSNKAFSVCASLLPVFAARFTFSKRFSTVSKSFNCNSMSIVSLSRIGFTLPST